MDDVNTDVTPTTPSAETPAGSASETPELELELEAEAVGDDQADAEDELDDWEEEGKTYKVPKALKPHLLRNRDYTQSKQQLAEQRKADEAARKEFEDAKKFHREHIDTLTDLKNYDKQLSAFRAITPEQWSQMDPQKASQLQIKFNLLKDQRETAIGELRQKEHQALEKQRSEIAKQYEDSLARIAKEIPGWSDELAGKLNAYGVEQGFTLEQLERMVLQPKRVKTLHKAYLYDQLVAKQRARAAAPAAPAPTPVPKVGARRNPPSAEPSDSDDINTWVRKRNKQLGLVS